MYPVEGSSFSEAALFLRIFCIIFGPCPSIPARPRGHPKSVQLRWRDAVERCVPLGVRQPCSGGLSSPRPEAMFGTKRLGGSRGQCPAQEQHQAWFTQMTGACTCHVCSECCGMLRLCAQLQRVHVPCCFVGTAPCTVTGASINNGGAKC